MRACGQPLPGVAGVDQPLRRERAGTAYDAPPAGGATSIADVPRPPQPGRDVVGDQLLRWRYWLAPGRWVLSAASGMPAAIRMFGQSHSVRFGRSAATICRAWFQASWLLGIAAVCSAHHTS